MTLTYLVSVGLSFLKGWSWHEKRLAISYPVLVVRLIVWLGKSMVLPIVLLLVHVACPFVKLIVVLLDTLLITAMRISVFISLTTLLLSTPVLLFDLPSTVLKCRWS